MNYTRTYKERAIDILGGKCNSCDNEDVRVLQIDHIIPLRQSTNPREHGSSLYLRIIKGCDTSNLQVLCANCHIIKTLEHDNINYPYISGKTGIGTRKQLEARTIPQSNNSSGYVGVYYNSRYGWCWEWTHAGTRYRRQSLQSAIDAAIDRKNFVNTVLTC